MGTPLDALPYYYSGSFIRVGPRKKRKNKQQQEPLDTVALLEQTMDELACRGWKTQCQHMLHDAINSFSPTTSPEVLCLGLGSPSCSQEARAQLAFLVSICDGCDIQRRKVSIYDPVFTEDDMQLLRNLEFHCLTHNKTEYTLINPTILFMPHCDRNLYENVLRANWTSERLQNILFIANRFSDYADHIPTRKLMAESPCLTRIASCLDSRELPTFTSLATAFNNTSIQVVSKEALASLDPSFWHLPKLNVTISGLGC